MSAAASTIEQPTSLPAPAQSRAMARVGSQFLPGSFGELIKYAEYVAGSDLVPKDYRDKPANVAVAVQWGMELGLSPLQAVQNIAVINGRPTMWGDMCVALVQSQPDFVDMIDEPMMKGDEVVGYRVTVKRKGRTPVIRTFTTDDAKAAGLLGKAGPWQQYRARMLLNRARAFAIRDSYADALRGMSVREEVEDAIPGEYSVLDRGSSSPAPVVEMPKPKAAAAPAPAAANVESAAEPEQQGEGTGTPAVEKSAAQPTPAGEPGIHGLSDAQRRILKTRCNAANVPDAELLERYPRIDTTNLNAVMAWLGECAEKASGG
jgi:hypothetical protein